MIEDEARDLLIKSLQPANHGPASRWALVVDGAVVDLCQAAGSQAKVLADRLGGKAVGVADATPCSIGWIYRRGKFSAPAD
jgi:hypothetical protein